MRDAETSAQAKSEFVHLADRISQWFIFTVLTAATVLVLVFLGTDPHEGISRALALVIVTCPCVFGIAIPLSMSFAIRSAAQSGIVIKNSDAVENLWGIKTLFFDKTGTLTTGEMSVLKMNVRQPQDLRVALGLEKNQAHPVARAIVKHLLQLQVQAISFDDVTALPGGGVGGKWEEKSFASTARL